MKRTPEEERIYQALSAIETPEASLEEGVRSRLERRERQNRPYFRMAAVAACLVVLLGAAVGAAGFREAWRYFFPGVPEHAVTEVNISQTNRGYTLTVEDAVADDTGMLLLLSLTRTDGAEIDPDLRMYFGDMSLEGTLSLDGKKVLTSSGGYGMDGRIRSGDGKTLYFVENLSIIGEEALAGRTLTYEVPALGKWYEVKTATLSLETLAEREIPTYAREPEADPPTQMGRILAEQDCDLPIPQVEGFSGAAVRGALMTENGLSIAVESVHGVRDLTDCIGVEAGALIDTRTGERYEAISSTTAYLPDGTEVWVTSFRECPLTAEDLPWLELEAEYQIAQLVTTEPFQLSFQVDTSAARTIPLEPIQAEGKTLLLRELRLSAREIALELERDEAYDAALRVPLALTLTDGTVLEPWGYSGRQDGESCILEYTLLTEDGVPCLLDTSQVAAVTIGDVTFDVPQ